MKSYIDVGGKTYRNLKLIGHGKGGYSYLVETMGKHYVLKQIHHEPCDYYKHKNKLEEELEAYKKLNKIGIRMPKLIEVDVSNEIIIKEYISGDTIYDRLRTGESVEKYIPQVEQMANIAQNSGLNIDYFPTNFGIKDEMLYYIDYECDEYVEEKNFANWGIKYWSRTMDFLKYVEEHEVI
ncbi:hypothetical protein [Lachnobacterium bovis]|uniref:Serine/threonine protein kinase n=1 Tax=Lachnobacterium bovis TaxID=140626 RepID=A0A1H9QZM1_9FIRM|nr:hypothetical protein [Lachnobacterium bovis]SER66051.1 hypothetical protein SAMN02910429_00712 [Lachnobacterium bovis]